MPLSILFVLTIFCVNLHAQGGRSAFLGRLPALNAVLPDGSETSLNDLIEGKYTVLAAGCLTCPEFHRGYREIEAANVDYAKKDVQFFFVYKSLRHPELDGYLQPQNLSERLLQLEIAKGKLGTNIPWLVDNMENEMREALDFGANSVYLISPEGEVVYSTERINIPSFRSALVKHVGQVGEVTTANELDLPRARRPERLINEDSDIRVERPDGLVVLKLSPSDPDETYYVKLRAEAEPELLKNGTGRLFIGFYPDPIHGAHWNNLTEPMRYTLKLPEGVEASPCMASAKKGSGKTDSDPRQFWVSFRSDSPIEDTEITLNYFACTDSLCLALSQSYTIHFEAVDDGSRTFGMNRGSKRKKK